MGHNIVSMIFNNNSMNEGMPVVGSTLLFIIIVIIIEFWMYTVHKSLW